ncbi:MAG: magnesium transporter [Planctomycetes bacterium]|nr:magnesium transporter [Planctomycetota bacterium]
MDHATVDRTLRTFVERMFERDQAGAARLLETMDEGQVVDVLRLLPPAVAGRVVRQLQVTYAAALLREAEAELFVEIARELEPQHAAAIFMHLPKEARERFLQHLPERLKRDVQQQLTFPEDSVGRMMSTQFLALRQDMTVREAVERIRATAQKRFPASYVYVVDDEDHLVGVMNMRDLMLAAPEQRLATVMRAEVFSLPCFTECKQAAAELSKRRYFAAPVVDAEQHMLGIIKAEQLLHGMQEDLTGDIQTMFGAGADERVTSPIAYSLSRRLPWLHVNLLTAFLAAGVVALFEGAIARMTVLAVFLPVVAGQGGNAGAQSLAIVMRGLVMREVPRGGVRRLIAKEALLGCISGTVTGAVTAVVAWLWYGNPWLGVVIGLAMVINLFAAGAAGAAIPLLMRALRLDPAQSSSIVLTTVTDVVGFFAFLGLALVFEARLIGGM